MNLLTAPVLSAPDDTWGIPGPTFLAGYLAVAVLVVVVGTIHQRRVMAGRWTFGADRIDPEQAGYLNGGTNLALYTAIGGLRGAGAIDVDARRRLVATGAPPAGAGELPRAVHAAAATPVTLPALGADPRVRAALDRVRQGLESSGLALSPEERRSARLGANAVIVLLLIGLARFFSGLANDRPVWYLFLVLCGLLVAWLVLRRVPYRTSAGARALRDLRSRHAHLNPTQSPAYTTYGVAGVAMGIAIFGTTSLWALDPAFAQQAEIQRQALAGGTSGVGGGSGTSGGSSCGSGSNCGGGSSCGGGGGCGGGGCGG